MADEIDPAQASKFAHAVLTQNLRLRPGENVLIEGWTHTLPWAVALSRETRRLRAHPLILYEDEAAYWDSVDAREDRLLGATPAHEWAALGKTDVYLHLWGAGDKVRLAALPDRRVEALAAYNEPWYTAARKAGLRGARLEVGRPFPNLARLYRVREAEWRDQVVEASQVAPERLQRTGAPIAKALERGRRVRIRDDHGTDLTLGLAHRRVQLQAGRVTTEDRKTRYGVLCSLPSGAIQLALDETVADGTIVANRTDYHDGGIATGGVFRFEGGRLIDHSFDTGAEFFDTPFRTAGAGRDRPGLLRIGLNPALRNTPQLEDTEAGAITVSVGGNARLGGKNTAQLFGFVVNAGARMEVDGRPVALPSSSARDLTPP